MANKPQLLTIQQASAATGLSVHTLRYYERIGLLRQIGRAENGHRRYSSVDMDRLKLLTKLILTKMPLEKVQRYALLMEQGDATIAERESILSAHRAEVLQQMDDLRETLAIIDYKLAIYKGKATT